MYPITKENCQLKPCVDLVPPLDTVLIENPLCEQFLIMATPIPVENLIF